jgi:iron-sulfur cluster insertion protein
MGENMITITEQANSKVSELIAEENNPNLKLRVFVQGGGCRGMQYGFAFEEESNDDDFVFENNGTVYLVDSMSIQYLEGATIDYKESFEGNSFVISNPNAETTCGCGSSFSV